MVPALFPAGPSARAGTTQAGWWTVGVHHRVPASAASSRIVKVSLEQRVVYVLEGGQPLLVAPICSGMPGHATPTGDFHVRGKAKRRRSGRYGFWVKDGRAVEGTRAGGPPDRKPGWRYVGYPMPFWIGFLPGYGFHEGFLWSAPRTHGCLHLTGRDAERLYELIGPGTPVSIAKTQPEDRTLGKNVRHPEEEKAPDPPASFFLSDKSFTTPWEDILRPGREPARGLGAKAPDATTHKEQEPDRSRGNGTGAPDPRPS